MMERGPLIALLPHTSYDRRIKESAAQGVEAVKALENIFIAYLLGAVDVDAMICQLNNCFQVTGGCCMKELRRSALTHSSYVSDTSAWCCLKHHVDE